MLTQIYIEALLVGEKLADQVWEAWNVRFWPKADPENWSFAVVKASALEKSRHSDFVSASSEEIEIQR